MPASQRLRDRLKFVQSLESAISLMGWDTALHLPSGSSGGRAEHQSRLSGTIHSALTSDEHLADVDALEKSSDGGRDKALLRVLRRDLKLRAKVPTAVVERKAKVGSDAYSAWRAAKPANDFKRMEPYYTELVEIGREVASLIGFKDHPYDALIDQFEEGSTTAEARAIFQDLKAPTIDLVRRVSESGKGAAADSLTGSFDSESLRTVAQEMASRIGFDFTKGRLDLAYNAFCTTIALGDVRMTTRPSERIHGVLSSSLHEMGHGLYEQGLPEDWDGTPVADGVSLAVHESQSRMWENVVGRSHEFWSFFYPWLQPKFPQLANMGLDQFHRALNAVEAGPVRVGSDELTYNLHILIRFELEVALIEGSLTVRDLPEVWNAKYKEYLGVTPASLEVGVLQDVHWTRGMFGYFPTYTMGNLISAQLWDAMLLDIPDAMPQIARGEFDGILGWMREHIHNHGSAMAPKELIQKATGKPMQTGPWLKYATDKFTGLYLS